MNPIRDLPPDDPERRSLHDEVHARPSAQIRLPALVTFVAVALAAVWWPDHVQPEQINLLGYAGALLVVLGSALTALGPSLLAGWRARRARLALLRP